MLKSLFAGVSGLQSHQVAMDVESNNIANVNTTGYKYSRANFSDLLAQTKSIATAPQGELGGRNAVQVGLGSQVSSMTRIYSQGSVQNTDKNTDVAIQGDGFFIVSPDGGNTYKYTRAGDFKFDSGGNFVDNGGFIVQGWSRDDETGVVDTSAPISNINIPPGLTTPANPTEDLVLKANLNSGPVVESFAPAYEVATTSTGDAVDTNGRVISSGDMGVMYNESGEALSLQDSQGVWASFKAATLPQGAAVAAGAVALDTTFTLDDGSTVNVTSAAGPATNTALNNANAFMAAINAKSAVTGVVASVSTLGELTLRNENSNVTAAHNINFTDNTGTSGIASGSSVTAYQYQYSPTSAVYTENANKTFTTIADLRAALQAQARADGGAANGIEVIVNEQGKLEISNTGTNATDDYDVNFRVTAISTAAITENTRFTSNMLALNTVIPAGSAGKAYSQAFNTATHSASIDVFDSLGSKHTVRMEFRKTSVDSATGSTWDMVVSVPAPAQIDTIAPLDEKTGSVKFNSDGSLATFNPPNISFTGNNGSSPDQQINLRFGTTNAFDGMTSFDSPSATSGISQDGFTGGDIVGIRIDQSGALIGSFSNGRSFALAQIGMAKFTNNEGLATEGGNVYAQTANSGDPIIGTAATAGRGFIQSSALEASNVDLSTALTQLIIIQRGYQANGKTITTSDQLLQTLIGLKN
ncbi:flagellar hook protein FlgE [Sulfurimonas aquatica]|uniref:Flagellar hook protein FlgE n=1 Tax=Sulfurimonas aquatica TaxID=2672570 RepID=A0A975AXW5_9BACT|nr:flagellar hook protein FlgE [Sulfurimonas aquatica]QSZ40621.1 flagellar hook protein FlgE [Sulfurimonas aquatica]